MFVVDESFDVNDGRFVIFVFVINLEVEELVGEVVFVLEVGEEVNVDESVVIFGII